ncbi:MAG: PAS domain S-box protein [Chloroflexota bacterium]
MQINRQFRTLLKKGLQLATQPALRIQDSGVRRKAALLSGLLLLMFTAQTLSIIYRMLFVVSYQLNARHVIIVASLGVLYLVSRGNYYPLVASLTSAFYPLAIFTVVIGGRSSLPELALMGLPVSLIVGNLLLSLSQLAILGGINLIAILIIVIAFPDRLSQEAYEPMIITFNVVAVGFAVVSRWLHQQIEQDRLSALQESEERFRQLAENIQEVFWISRPGNAGIEYVSPLIEQVWGRPPQQFYDDPKMFLKTVYADDRENIVTAMVTRQRAGEATSEEYRIVHPSGAIRWIWDRGFPLSDSRGEVYRVMGIAQDITERKLAEDALYVSEARYRALFEQNNDAIFILDLNENRTTANQRAADMLGYTLEEAQKISYIEITAESKETERVVDRLLAGEQIPIYERLFLKKHGEVFTVEINATLVIDRQGTPLQIQSVIRDITERKRTETALRVSEARYRALFEQNHDAIFIVDLNGNQAAANPRAAEILGYTLEEVQTLSLNQVSAEPQQSNDVLTQLMAGETVPIYERLLLKRNREIIPVEISVSLVRDEAGTPLHIQSVVRDITERKQANERLQSQEKFISAVVNTTPALVYVYDMETQSNVYSNTGIQRLLGYTEEEIQVMGSSLFETLIASDDLPKVIAFQSKILQATDSEILEISYKIQHKDGSWRNLYSYEHVFLRNEDGSVKQKIGVAIDVTDRTQTEIALQASETRYRMLFNLIDEGVAINEAIYDDHGDVVDYRIIDVNPAFEKHSIYKIDQAIGRLATELYELDTNFIRDWWRDQTRIDIAAHTEMYHEPSERWFYVRTTPPKDKRFATIFIDITERKQAEESLKQYREHLEDLVDERTTELQQMVSLMSGREVRMAELKDVIRQLRTQLQDAGITPVVDDPLA